MEKALEKARTLVEALPWLRAFAGKTLVIKYGGHAMTDESCKASFAQDVVLLQHVGIRPVVVHGGGPQIDVALDRMGIKSTFVQGLRVTDEPTMGVVEMVLAGQVNGEVVTNVTNAGGRAVGLSGRDATCILGRKIEPREGEPDIGRVGEVVRVDARLIRSLLDNGFLPIIAPVAVDADGRALNINADTVAGRVAGALGAEKLVLLTDIQGILDRDRNLINELDERAAERAIEDGTVSGGMIPKVRSCLDALSQGVGSVHVIDGRVPHALLLEIFTDRGVGTVIRR
ncbi:acetylglutamate kinase [Vulgatibacter sp.]|uniref:acetylglutamate kinase n=1 Tax=Vulgatibacter sp. TaxID=1971226 RepID=UPI003563EBC9